MVPNDKKSCDGNYPLSYFPILYQPGKLVTPCKIHYSPESWQVVNMEYLHWGYGICKGCMYVLSIEY